MKKADELREPHSCLNASDPAEPLFVLCGRDPVAGETVRVWAYLFKAHHVAQGTWDSVRRAKYATAKRSAEDLDAWLAQSVTVVGDGAPTPYNGEPYYCAECGLGFAEFVACEHTDCRLETRAEAQERKRAYDAGEIPA